MTSTSSRPRSASKKLRYLHRNPVSRALVEKPEDYAWSSFRAYALQQPGPVTITRIA
jgi:putative transposase